MLVTGAIAYPHPVSIHHSSVIGEGQSSSSSSSSLSSSTFSPSSSFMATNVANSSQTLPSALTSTATITTPSSSSSSSISPQPVPPPPLPPPLLLSHSYENEHQYQHLPTTAVSSSSTSSSSSSSASTVVVGGDHHHYPYQAIKTEMTAVEGSHQHAANTGSTENVNYNSSSPSLQPNHHFQQVIAGTLQEQQEFDQHQQQQLILSEYSSGPLLLSTSPLSSNGSTSGGCGTKMGLQSNGTIHSTAEYLQQLLKDRARLAAFPGTFLHAERLLDAGKLSYFFLFY